MRWLKLYSSYRNDDLRLVHDDDRRLLQHARLCACSKEHDAENCSPGETRTATRCGCSGCSTRFAVECSRRSGAAVGATHGAPGRQLGNCRAVSWAVGLCHTKRWRCPRGMSSIHSGRPARGARVCVSSQATLTLAASPLGLGDAQAAPAHLNRALPARRGRCRAAAGGASERHRV